MNKTYPQREQYMNNEISHHDFYLSIAKAAGIKHNADFVLECKKALDRGDEHLNTIPLAVWDRKGVFVKLALSVALKKHGDGWCLSNNTCAQKEMAREQVSLLP